MKRNKRAREVVQGIGGYAWYQGEYFDTVEDIFNQCLGIEFIKEKK